MTKCALIADVKIGGPLCGEKMGPAVGNDLVFSRFFKVQTVTKCALIGDVTIGTRGSRWVAGAGGPTSPPQTMPF